MDNKTTVQTVMDAVQAGNFDAAKPLLADGFLFSGPVPQPINGAAWLGMSATLKKAFPDLNYHFKVEGEKGDAVSISAQLTGTHKGELNLSALGMPTHAATGKSFSTPAVRGTATVRDGKIQKWEVEPNPEAGVPGILKQLGLPMSG
jgi:hypothetical protein